MPTKQQQLSIYPISSGNELNIFAGIPMAHIRIMDMHGEVLLETECNHHKNCVIDITQLVSETYLAEITFKNQQTTRSVFVKL